MSLPLASGRARAPVEPAALDELLDARPSAWLRRVPGRETFVWPAPRLDGSEPKAGRCVVKRTEGFVAVDVWRAWPEAWRAWIVGRRPRSPGLREYENLAALRAEGFPVPRPIAWCAEAGRLPRRSLVVMEEVLHRDSLRAALARADGRERARWSAELLEIVVRLHERGWYHRDLYLQHFLVVPAPDGGGSPRLVLVDVARARKQTDPRRRWFVKDLAALLCSTPPSVPPFERLRFLARYLDRRGIGGRGARRAWARAVAAKSARMAAHVPRDERGARAAPAGG